jgi:hypothetical protein
MKRIFSLTLCAALIAVCLTGCVSVNFSPWRVGMTVTGVGEMERFEIQVGDFDEIRFSSVGVLHYNASPSDTVVLEIQANLRDHYEVEVRGGVLYIGSTGGINITNTSRVPVITVHAPGLKKLTISGAGSLRTHDTITVDSFELNISGAASGTAELEVSDFSVLLSGAGALTLTGTADSARMRMSGAGSINALDLVTRTADVTMSGAGAVRVNCTETLNINASGVGSVEYRGGARVDLRRSGVVSVRQVD